MPKKKIQSVVDGVTHIIMNNGRVTGLTKKMTKQLVSGGYIEKNWRFPDEEGRYMPTALGLRVYDSFNLAVHAEPADDTIRVRRIQDAIIRYAKSHKLDYSMRVSMNMPMTLRDIAEYVYPNYMAGLLEVCANLGIEVE